jgi:hypothetical protein
VSTEIVKGVFGSVKCVRKLGRHPLRKRVLQRTTRNHKKWKEEEKLSVQNKSVTPALLEMNGRN